MKVYLVSFPDDFPILRRLVKKEKREVLLSYFFLRESKPLRLIIKKMEGQNED